MKSPFKILNGRTFRTILVAAADGDKNILKMYSDNLERMTVRNKMSNEAILKYVEDQDFLNAIAGAFDWGTAPEGLNFWVSIHTAVEKIIKEKQDGFQDPQGTYSSQDKVRTKRTSEANPRPKMAPKK